ncbi:MAG: DUF1844 domain-containing protein [Limisphaera sp.]|jgi:hypothetical protein
MPETETASQHQPEAGSERHSALFARLVLQLADLAMVMMGRVPNPQTGQTHRDFDAAQMFIDQLEMLEVKTRGNLLPEESRLLRDTLMQLRLSFVDAVEQAGAQTESRAPEGPADAPAPGQPAPSATPADSTSTTGPARASEDESESRRRFFKKYDV